MPLWSRAPTNTSNPIFQSTRPPRIHRQTTSIRAMEVPRTPCFSQPRIRPIRCVERSSDLVEDTVTAITHKEEGAGLISEEAFFNPSIRTLPIRGELNFKTSNRRDPWECRFFFLLRLVYQLSMQSIVGLEKIQSRKALAFATSPKKLHQSPTEPDR